MNNFSTQKSMQKTSTWATCCGRYYRSVRTKKVAVGIGKRADSDEKSGPSHLQFQYVLYNKGYRHDFTQSIVNRFFYFRIWVELTRS